MLNDKNLEVVARAIYEADPNGGYDPDDEKTFWMAEDGYWPPAEKPYVWAAWLQMATAASLALDSITDE